MLHPQFKSEETTKLTTKKTRSNSKSIVFLGFLFHKMQISAKRFGYSYLFAVICSIGLSLSENSLNPSGNRVL